MANLAAASCDMSGSYTVYMYNANRPHRNSTDGTTLSTTPTTVSQMLQQEAKTNADFSLSVIATSLDIENEAKLRSAIAKRLSRGTVFSSGHVIDDMCIFYLLRKIDGSGLQTDKQNSFCHQEFVVCYSTTDMTILDNYQTELTRFSQGLLSVIDLENLRPPQLSEAVRKYINPWYNSAVLYVARVIELLGQDLAFLMHAALLNLRVEFVHVTNEDLKMDIDNFVASCSLQEFLSEEPQDNKKEGVLKIVSDSEGKLRFENATEVSSYCKSWSQALLSANSEDPTRLKQLLDSYKLKIIQDINTLKRLVRQAETDHYALYRAYIFLQQTGNARLVLKHMKACSKDSQNVVDVLENFISCK